MIVQRLTGSNNEKNFAVQMEGWNMGTYLNS